MSANGPRPSDDIDCFHVVPEHHDPVEPYHGAQLRAGEVLDGRFIIGEPLSRSGMATIYKAQDRQNNNQPVALKVPHLHYESDPNFFNRFEREEEIGRKLDHPYLLKFIPVEGKSRPYLVTEYLNGCTLAHLLEAMRPLPEKDVHRDLKPSNIMICPDRTIRLIDFGIASAAASRRITMTGLNSTMGTPDYMAPEQVSNKATDERTDIYSLGVILYEMLTGVLPFQHENPWVAMTNRVSGDPVAPRKLNPKISAQAEEIVLRAMRRAPSERYQSAAAFKVALNAPEQIEVTGICNRLEVPHWKFGFRETPVVAGTLIALAFILFQVLLFLLLRNHVRPH